MMRSKITLMAVAFMLLWGLGPVLAAEVSGKDADKELAKLQGVWVMVSGEKDGKPVANEHVSKSKIKFEGNKGEVTVPHQHPEPIVFEIVKIDPTKNPKEMHVIRKSGPNAGKELVGIYEFDGDDQYKFAFDPAGKVTLKEFATKAGTGHIRNTWKRVKQ